MSETPRWRFETFEADAAEWRLSRAGEPVPLTRKAFALLVELLKRPGKLVTKDELFATVWAGTVVTDAALSRAVRELRVALGDEAGAPRFIATAHGLGFRFIAPLASPAQPPAAPAHAAAEPASAQPAATTSADAGPPAPEAAHAERPQGLTPAPRRTFGREAELALLLDARQQVLQGRRQVVFVTGDAGIGKTALVEDFIAASGIGGGWVAQGRCVESFGTGEPYLPVLEALDALARQMPAGAMAELLLRFAPGWLAQLPWLAQAVEPSALRQALANVTAQRMLREATQALEALAAQRPLLLWLEDLHWSDPSTLELLGYLAGRREPCPLMVVASFRPDLPPGSALAALSQQLLQRGQARMLPLGLLDPPALSALIAQRAPPAPGLPLAELTQALHRRTEGHALFAVTILDDLLRGGALRRTGAGYELGLPLAELGTRLPEGLRALVRQRLDLLGDDDRRLIEAASVVGADFDAAALAAALGQDMADVEEGALRLLQSGRLLRHRAPVTWPDGTEAGGFGFAHALYWQGIFEGVAPARRAQWQLRIAERLEQAFEADTSPVAAELAMRFEAAREPTRALIYLAQAAQGALRRCAYREGADHLQHALMLLPELPAAQRERRELELQLTLGAAQMALHGYGSADVDATYRRALALGRRCARPGELERTLRGQWNVALVRGELEAAQLAADELVLQASAAGDRSAAFDAFAKLGQTAMHRGEFAAARRQLEYALALPLPADDPLRQREAPRVLAYLAWVLWFSGQGERALQRASEALEQARASGGAHTTAFVLGFAAWLHQFRGEPQAMRDLAQQQAALALEHGLVYWQVWAESLLALAQALQADGGEPAGRAQAGRRAMARALEGFTAQGAEVGVSHFRTVLAEQALAAGDLAMAEDELQAAMALLDRNGNAYYAADLLRLQGALALARGDAEQAQQRGEAALRQARLQGARALELRAAVDLARLWRRQGRAETAQALLAPLINGYEAGGHRADLAAAGELIGARAGDPVTPPSPSAAPAASGARSAAV